MHIYAFYNDFSARPRYGAMFQALYFQNGYIELYMCIPLESLLNGLIGGKFSSQIIW